MLLLQTPPAPALQAEAPIVPLLLLQEPLASHEWAPMVPVLPSQESALLQALLPIVPLLLAQLSESPLQEAGPMVPVLLEQDPEGRQDPTPIVPPALELETTTKPRGSVRPAATVPRSAPVGENLRMVPAP